jgi:hypothetical protein
MARAGHNSFSAGSTRCFDHAGILSRDYAALRDVHRAHALPYARYEGLATKKAKRLLRESDRGEARRDNYQRRHPPPEIARPDAKVTPLNIAIAMHFCEENFLKRE